MAKNSTNEYVPVALKPASEAGSKTTFTMKSKEKEEEEDYNAEEVLKSLQRAQNLCKAVKESLSEEDMDIKKKFESKKQQRYMYAAADRGEIPEEVVEEFSDKTKDFKKLPEKVKKSHDGLSPYTQGEPIIDEHVSADSSANRSQLYVTPGNSDPREWAGTAAREVDPLDPFYEIKKALRSISILGLSRRERLNVAYRAGVLAGENKPFRSEPVDLSGKLNVGVSENELRPGHEPPVVPVRRVETPPQHTAVEWDEPTYRTEQGGPQEAKPFWRR